MNERVLEALNRLDDDLLEDYFKTKAKFTQNKTRPRLFLQKYVSLAACFVVVFAVAFAVLVTKLNDVQGDLGVVGDSMTPDNGTNTAPDASVDEELENGLAVSPELYEAIKNAQNEDALAVVVSSQIVAPTDFYYNGKTYAEYNISYIELGKASKRLNELLVDGEYLKYGEALYKDGAPDGTKWTREVYEKTVNYYGDDLLNRYIVNGEFLKEELSAHIKDVENAREALEQTFDEIGKAYSEVFAEENLPLFDKISEDAKIENGKIYLSITKKAFLELSIENKTVYFFDLAP